MKNFKELLETPVGSRFDFALAKYVLLLGHSRGRNSMNRKKLGTYFVALALFATSLTTISSQAAPQDKRVYIVKFQDSVSLGDEISAARRSGVAVNEVLANVFKGFVGEMTAVQATALSRNPRVDFVEADSEVSINATVTQDQATWGLDRIDQINNVLDLKYQWDNDGAGVDAYVIDTGIRLSHVEFSGRTKSGYSAIKDRRGTSDCNGHGTHVAGTIGGTTYGVAKKVNLIPVRVLDCRGSGFTSDITKGIDWIINDHKNGIPAVANLSLGGGASSALDTSVQSLISDGVVTVVAAGNSNVDASNTSPARVEAAITVGATTSNDARASYSNFGSILDIFAPGSSITSAGYQSDTATATMSGTSMAAPHVAGAAARYLSQNKLKSPADVRAALVSVATKSIVTNPGSGSPNILLFTPLLYP